MDHDRPIYDEMLHFHRTYCYGKSSVCPQRCGIVITCSNSSKIISRSVSLGCSLSEDPNITDHSKGKHHINFGRNRRGVRKKWLSSHKISKASYTLVTKSTSTRSILLKVDGIDQTVDFVTSVYERSTESNESQVHEY